MTSSKLLTKNFLCLILFCCFLSIFNSAAQLPAFPTAYGAGAYTEGGRGGKVVHVTKLDDVLDSSDPNYVGTLRWALKGAENKGVARTIVFDVSGIIDLQDWIYVSNLPGDEGGYADGITIAGQSAPEGGITLTGNTIKIKGINNIIVRYLKFRITGDYGGGISIGGGDNYLLDHLSGSHCPDSIMFSLTFNGEGGNATDHTIQNCLVGNSKNGIIIGNSDFAQGATELPYGSVSVLRNAFYSVSWRVPGKFGGAGKFDVINNVAHNWKSRLMRTDPYPFEMNHIGNHYQSGGQSRTRNYPNLHKTWTGFDNGAPSIYQEDNYYSPDLDNGHNKPNHWSVFQGEDSENVPTNHFTNSQLPIQGRAVPILNSMDVFEDVLESVGASKYIKNDGTVGFYRDQYDTFQVNGIETQDLYYSSNRDIELPVQSISNTRPDSFYVNNSHIPEVWFAANVPDGQDHNDIAPSGYTWLEEYLNQVDYAEAIGGDTVTLSPNAEEIPVNSTLQLEVVFNTSDTLDESGTFASSNPEVATVDSNGLVTAISVGETTITFTSNENPALTDTSQITVFNDALQASAGNDQSICEGEITSLTATGGTNYLWNTGETTATIEVNPTETTTYSVTVSNDEGQEASANVTVTVNEMPELSISNDVTIIEGESTMITISGAFSYLWNTGGTVESFEASPTETTTYSVVGTNGNCSAEAEVTVTVYKANAGLDERVCENDDYEVVLTANQGDSYLWSTGETTQSITVSPLSTTEYSVSVTSGNLTDSDDVTVYVDPNPNVVITNGESIDILDGDFVTLSATGANTYEWSNGATQPNVAVSPSQTTTYEVRGYINDCYDEKAITVNVYEQVVANAGPNISICLDETATLTASGGDEYLWSTGETTSSIEVSPQVTTDYYVTVFNAMHFDEASVSVEVDTNCEQAPSLPGEESTDFGMDIYPNPASDYVNVEISGVFDASLIEVYDISGKRIIREEVSNENQDASISKRVNVSQLLNGIYILKLVDDEREVTRKLIVN